MDKRQLVYVVSGGVGASGEQLVRTALAQFPAQETELEVIPRVRSREKIEEITARAAQDGGLVVHTMVNDELRQVLAEQLEQLGIPSVDLMGELMSQFSQLLGKAPSGVPGLYRQLHHSYFERVEAIDYSLEHDDGIDPPGWPNADVLLIGPSRTGKTPISMYLAVAGWKTANYPIVPGIHLPPELDDLKPAKVIGLTIDPVRLKTHRTQRQKRLGTLERESEYTDLRKIFEELDSAEKFYRKAGYRQVDVTDKPIESCAAEILRLIPNRD